MSRHPAPTPQVATLATSGLAAGALALTPGPAQAAATYDGQCGAGYRLASELQITGGTVFLARKRDAGCAVTIRTNPGARIRMSVWIRASGTTTWISAPGNYTHYAGPVYSSSPWQCWDYGGQINGAGGTRYDVCPPFEE
ncbi:hypothetical protein [Actinoplanes sp. NBRC 103695]|uniref:hypothetical protein n=1 Tax=Actinoplanes sp. NBRC 103695 TaxID=3032202 RepID=UPI0024A2C8FE|nr:hypothetical protein [Actinoplanes sp. NBRC 103695]GLY98374.1 hypothetical protein Acsp02_56280 [Actinoplanes sp. NBRC 103695]